ncbi:transcription-associated protein 1, partial [Coemansia asiatica]
MAITNFEVYATRLRDERLDTKLKQTIAHELCDSLEFFQLQDYTRFVAILWPVIRDLLLKTPPVFVSSVPEQKLRATLLEIIQRIPHSEVFRPVVLEVVTTLLKLVKVENEENAVVCLKIIYELHRMYRQLLESIALPFLDLAAEIYRNADQMLKAMDSLDTPASLSTPNVNLMSPSAMSPGPDAGDMATKNLNKATTSFKVLTEIPIIVVSIIQANRRHADPFVSNILPLILHMLELNPKSTLAHGEPAQLQLQYAHQYQHWRSAHADLITAQSKTLSFLAFFARGFTALLLPLQDRIARLTYQLLCLCPAESTATRKEMLIATRHIVSTEIRKAFVPIADRFLDMQVLVGSGLASQCILKPFAFSMLADLMHHIRLELSPSQLTKMVDFYAGCMHDQSLSSGVHTMCAKLLHNITERIMHIPDKRHGRILLLSILRTFISSFAAIGNQAETAIQDIRSGGSHAEDKIYGSNELIRTNAFEQGDKVKELRFLLRSLVTGCKNVIYGLKRCDSVLGLGMEPQTNAVKSEEADTGAANGQRETASGGSAVSEATAQEAELVGFELDLLASLFREGLRACRINDIERVKTEAAAEPKAASKTSNDNINCSSDSCCLSDDDSNSSTHVLSREAQIKMLDREDKEQIEQFANLFVGLDLTVFHELFTSQFDYAFSAMIEHCTAISCVQVFVASDPNSPAFISIMLRYLCDRLDLLGSADEICTSTMLHLFKVAFLALALYPEANEPVLQPYVQTIINSALSISKNAKCPKNYFLLLRALFRSIGGGRYESLYKEVFPVLQNLLETLNSALGFTKLASSMQELFVEICLTVPVRLSVLLPYLSLLMKPLVFALESGPELVSQGLRTLELCIDNLTREFLDPILTPVMDDIMSSLWLHLRLPASASTHAPVAARILGKLGGRNRHMLLTRFPANPNEPVSPSAALKSESDKLVVPMTFEGLPGLVSMPLMDAIMFSIKVLGDRVATRQLELARKDAIEFVIACARYTLVLPFVSDGKAGKDASRQTSSLGHGLKLISLTNDPLALKRLLNMSAPSSQGSQNLERIISVCESVGDTFKADAPVATSEAALTATDITLSDLCAGTATSSRNPPLSHGGLMQIIWALSLASMYSTDARDLLNSIIATGAKQHVAQCVEAISADKLANEDGGAFATALANTVPEVISRVLVSHSRRLRITGASMLQCFYKALQEQVISKPALVGQLPAMRNIVSDLCAACYDPSVETKHSGCVGIAFIVEKLELGRSWLADHLLELSKALLFTLKDVNSSVLPGTNTDESRDTLLQIIKQAFPAEVFALAEEAEAEAEAETEAEQYAMETDGEGKSKIASNSNSNGGNVIATDVQMSEPRKSDTNTTSASPGAAGKTADADPPSKSPLSPSVTYNDSANTAEKAKLDNKNNEDDNNDDDKMAVDSQPPKAEASAISDSEPGANNAGETTSKDNPVKDEDANTNTRPDGQTSSSPQPSASNANAAANISNTSNVVNGDPKIDASASELATTNNDADMVTDKHSQSASVASKDSNDNNDNDSTNNNTNANANVNGSASASAGEGELAKSAIKSSQELMAASTQQATLAFKRLTAGLSSENSRLLKSFLALITKELANPSNEVREAAKACLAILVDVTRCSITALLLPFRDRLLGPIFGKPLRALPHNMQIGNIDAITYCLSLDPPFLEINEELLRLLSEALALADAEDQALVNHPAQVRSNTVSLTHLRHVCIRMLTAAMVRPEFSDSKNTPTRARIISVFFKSLYHKSVEVVDAANDGLKQVLLQQQKLPRDLLQTGLRPILLNLSDYKRLTVASLDGLARLLQLLTNYFKVEVGRKLLDHMQQWANPQLLQAASEKSVEDMHEIKILVAILQVFYLLPSTAGVLLDDLVGSVVNLEVHLCRRESSPFRKPLFKFLNRYPTESVIYFIKRVDSPHYMRIFTHALSSLECSPLRDALVAQTPALIDLLREFCIKATSFNSSINNNNTDNSRAEDGSDSMMAVDSQPVQDSNNAQSSNLSSAASDVISKRLYTAMSAMTMIYANLKYSPLWLEERSDLLQALMATWTAAHPLDMAPNKSSRLAKPALLELIVRCLLVSTKAMNNPSVVLFKLLEIAGRSIDVIDISFVFQYIWTELIVKWPISKRREILSAFLVRLSDPNVSDESNAIILQHLINPMVATVFTLPEIAVSDIGSSSLLASRSLSQEQRGIDLLRGQVIHLINQRVWAVHMPNNAQPSSIKRASVRLELVQLSSILIRHAASAVADQRKDIIKFGWNYIRNDDIMIKNASYVLVAQFIAAFDTPPKIILQAYSSLLKAHQVESRFLVRQSLDILLPVLPIRLMPSAPQQGPNADAGGGPAGGLPAWVVLAKRILIDNSASLAHTTHVYQLIAGHPAIFFPYRAQFATNLVGILQKMCLTHSATTETRTLALDIMDLFLKWHAMLEDSTKSGADRSTETSEAQVLKNSSDASLPADANSDATSAANKQQGSDSSSAATAAANGSAPTQPAQPAPQQADLLMSESRRETIVGLLLRMLCLVFDFALKSNLGPRALGLLTQYLDSSKWAPMHLRLTFFERSMQQIEAQGMNQQLVLHILTVLSAVTEQMQPVWFEEYYGVLVSIVRKCMSVDNGQVQKIVASMLRQLYSQAVRNERLGSSQVVTDLKTHVEAAISKNLLDSTNVYGTLLMLHAIGEYTGEQFYSYIAPLMKLVQRYTKEHNSHSATVAASQSASNSQSSGSGSAPPALQPTGSVSSLSTLGSSDGSNGGSRAASSDADILRIVSSGSDHQIPLSVEGLVKGETALDILLLLLLLLRDHISRLGDQRRSFLTHIIQLIERSSDAALLHVVLAMVREWVMDPQEVFPTIKEKAMLMSSMMCFVHGSASASDNASRVSVRTAASNNGADTDAGDAFALLERKYLGL